MSSEMISNHFQYTDWWLTLLKVIEVNLTTSENPILLEKDKDKQNGMNIEFTYSVNWYPTDIDFDDRFDKYLDWNFFEHQVQSFSVFIPF
jgi:transmembrane 9 superfamily member 3